MGKSGRICLAAVCVVVHASSLNAQQPTQPPPTLQKSMSAFITDILYGGTEDLRDYFSRTNDLIYATTDHRGNCDSIRITVYSGEEVGEALAGPLRIPLQLRTHGQTVGALAHQILIRGGEWRYVGNGRFVPPGARSDSATYLVWRNEGTQWFIAEIGDERFSIDRLPPWCCE